MHQDRVRYLRKLRGADGNADAAVTLDAVHESLFFLPGGEALADVLKLFGDGTTLRFEDAVRQLCAMDAKRPEPEVERYLAQLLRLGLLVVPDLHIDIHDPDPVSTYRSGLRGLGTSWADDIATLVERMGADVERFAGAGLARRRELLAHVKESVAETHRLLGRDDTPVLRTLVYEDTTLSGLAVTGDASAWTRQLTPACANWPGSFRRSTGTRYAGSSPRGSSGRATAKAAAARTSCPSPTSSTRTSTTTTTSA